MTLQTKKRLDLNNLEVMEVSEFCKISINIPSLNIDLQGQCALVSRFLNSLITKFLLS